MASVKFTMAAVEALSETEKNRLVVAFLLNSERGNIDNQAGADIMGYKNGNSFRANVGAAIKKIKDASEGGTTDPQSSSAAAPKKRKRNAGDVDAAGAREEHTDAGTTKKGSKKMKKKITKEEKLE